jgi:nicotinamide mononucleotide (NMN) deamidase PncC
LLTDIEGHHFDRGFVTYIKESKEEHFGAVGRGAVRVKSLKAKLDLLEQMLEEG